MDKAPHDCPTCGRALQSVLDYPSVRIVSVERLPLPEAIDDISEEAAANWLSRRRASGDRAASFGGGINRTPEIDRACQRDDVQQYFRRLESLVGLEVPPSELLPSWKPHGFFRLAHPVPDTKLYVALRERDPRADGLRAAAVEVLSPGPNLGSAGGPTLLPLGDLIQVVYLGLLRPAR